MQQAILSEFPEASISVSLIWIDMLPSDNEAAAREMARSIQDPRVRHYYDPRSGQRAGMSFAKGMLADGAGPAWDVYLFYDGEAEWSTAPPPPTEWFHQLGGLSRADPLRFRAGDALTEALRETAQKLVAERAPP